MIISSGNEQLIMPSTTAHQSETVARHVPGSKKWDVIRSLLACIYIPGGISYLVLGFRSPSVYGGFANQAQVGAYTTVWKTYVPPHVGILVPLVEVIELAIGGGLRLGDRTPKLAHGSGALFHTGLVRSGPWGPVNGLLAFLHSMDRRQPYSWSILERFHRWRLK